MNTITITRHAFVEKPRNNAKYGQAAPREGYINSWNEEYPMPETEDDWTTLDAWLGAEEMVAKAELSGMLSC